MSESAIEKIAAGVRGFAAEMQAKGIHVGMGNPGRCVTCGEPWPCAGGVLPSDDEPAVDRG